MRSDDEDICQNQYSIIIEIIIFFFLDLAYLAMGGDEDKKKRDRQTKTYFFNKG